jgi:methylenetetrahydrofolate dehydrogenase (NADP+)/methenyltetrahydrofolate cyclohydrolase
MVNKLTNNLNKIIDGKAYAEKIHQNIKKFITNLDKKPCLVVIRVGEDPASEVYVKNKIKKTTEVGMRSEECLFKTDVSNEELLNKIKELNSNNDVDGILVQLPLPKHINESEVIKSISVKKDVDGFHPENIGLSEISNEGVFPCTPLGCLFLLQSVLNIEGKSALVIGRSNIVGKPMARLLIKNNATVTVAHSKTKNLKYLCSQADIVVAAIGAPESIKGEWLKKDSVVIDVGINRIYDKNNKQKLSGDIEFDEAVKVVKHITPVPGGVGPMTIACLLHNTVLLYCRNNTKDTNAYKDYILQDILPK